VRDFSDGLRIRSASAVAIMFGVLTVLSDRRIILGPPAAAVEAVPIVQWFNFGAGFAYVLAGGLLAGKPWAIWLATIIPLSTIAIFGAFGAPILLGEPHGARTIVGMMLRMVIWQAITFIAWRAAPAAAGSLQDCRGSPQIARKAAPTRMRETP
jgi:hypothetical protein